MLMNVTPKKESIVDKITASPFEFYLTGSRYFKTATTKSDWVFFVEHSSAVTKWLIENGFTPWSLEDSYINDAICVEVWMRDRSVHDDEKMLTDDDDFSNCVRVQVVLDAKKKDFAQRIIATNEWLTTDKKRNRFVWEIVQATVEATLVGS